LAGKGQVVRRTNSYVEEVRAYPHASVAGRFSGDDSPVFVYLCRLAPNTRESVRYRLEKLEQALSKGSSTALTFNWHKLTYQQVMGIRAVIEARYPAGAANNYLITLRGVLRECWRLGLVEEQAFRRLMDVPLLPNYGTARPGRHVEVAEVRELLTHIRQDTREVGKRDPA
jgi:hypothetical protein